MCRAHLEHTGHIVLVVGEGAHRPAEPATGPVAEGLGAFEDRDGEQVRGRKSRVSPWMC